MWHCCLVLSLETIPTSYELWTMCGIPRILLLGTAADWQRLSVLALRVADAIIVLCDCAAQSLVSAPAKIQPHELGLSLHAVGPLSHTHITHKHD